MRFLTPYDWDPEDHYEDFRAAYDRYRRHLELLRGVLPERMLQLAQPSGLEDGLVTRVDHDRGRRVLRITMRVGDFQWGYSNLALTYVDAEITSEDDIALARIARTTRSQFSYLCDLTYHEVDAEEGWIVHRLLFYASDMEGYIEFAVRCRDLRWRRDPTRTRRLPPTADRYPGGPVSL